MLISKFLTTICPKFAYEDIDMKPFNIIIVVIFFISAGIKAQSNVIVEVKIKTSAVCEMCKKRIEDGLYSQKGIVQADLNIESKIVTIKYRSNKTTEDKIRTYISSLGYNADTITADKNAYDKLPVCCQSESGMH